jgi:hypothetical protein
VLRSDTGAGGDARRDVRKELQQWRHGVARVAIGVQEVRGVADDVSAKVEDQEGPRKVKGSPDQEGEAAVGRVRRNASKSPRPADASWRGEDAHGPSKLCPRPALRRASLVADAAPLGLGGGKVEEVDRARGGRDENRRRAEDFRRPVPFAVQGAIRSDGDNDGQDEASAEARGRQGEGDDQNEGGKELVEVQREVAMRSVRAFRHVQLRQAQRVGEAGKQRPCGAHACRAEEQSR